MKIYTKKGDDGTTGLQGNFRLSKSNPRIKAYGSIDESNACLGVALTFIVNGDLREILNQIQNDLFVVGADLSNPDLNNHHNRVTRKMITRVEKLIDKFEKELPPLKNFILPGGDSGAAQIHLSRTLVRRAETNLVELMESEKINQTALTYLNRLSDLLFVVARVINMRNGKKDILWETEKP